MGTVGFPPGLINPRAASALSEVRTNTLLERPGLPRYPGAARSRCLGVRVVPGLLELGRPEMRSLLPAPGAELQVLSSWSSNSVVYGAHIPERNLHVLH